MSSRGSWRDRPKSIPKHVGWKPKERAGEQERIIISRSGGGSTEVYAGGRVREISPTGKVIVSKIPSKSAKQIISKKIAYDKQIAEQRSLAKQQKKKQIETTYYVLHEKTGQKVRISPALAGKIAIDKMKHDIKHPKDSYSKFQTLLETKPPAQTRSAQFFGEMGQTERAMSSFIFGHDPEFAEIGGKPYKYEKGMSVSIDDKKYSVYPSRIGAFNWEEAKRYGKTGEKAGSITQATLGKYDPVKKVVRSGIEWEMEHPIVASATYGAGTLFGAGVKGIELGVVKATTKAPSLMKFTPYGKFLTTGAYGSMIGTAGYFSGKEILGSDDILKSTGEEIAKWGTFGAGAHAGGKLIAPKVETARTFQMKEFEKIGFDPKIKVSYTAQKEIRAIKDYENILFKKTYTREGLAWDKSRFKGFVEFEAKGFPRQTQLIPTTEKGFDIYTRYIPEAPKLAETGFQTKLGDYPIGRFARGGIYQTPETYMMISKLKGAPPITAPLQPIRFAGKGLGKKGSILAPPTQIGKGETFRDFNWFKEEYKWGGDLGIEKTRFKIGHGAWGKPYQPVAPDVNFIYGWRFDDFTGGKGEGKLRTDLLGGFAYGEGLLNIGKIKQPVAPDIADISKGFEIPRIDFSPKLRTTTKTKSRSATKQDIFQIPSIDLSKDFITIPKTPEFKQQKIIKEKIPIKMPIKPIVELPQFTPRAFRIRSDRGMGFRIKPIKLDIFPIADLFSKTITELGTRKPATQRKRSKKTKEEFAEFIKYGGLFPTKEMVTGKIKVWKLKL